jgi:hypothetical protein
VANGFRKINFRMQVTTGVSRVGFEQAEERKQQGRETLISACGRLLSEVISAYSKKHKKRRG